MDVDFLAGNEGKINWARMPWAGRLPELFRSENELRTVAAYNSNESFGLKQFGGTFHLSMGQIAPYVAETGVDDRNLGRWAWSQFKGRNGHSTQIVSVYVPCRSMGEEMVYKQHSRHLRKNGIHDCALSFCGNYDNSYSPGGKMEIGSWSSLTQMKTQLPVPFSRCSPETACKCERQSMRAIPIQVGILWRPFRVATALAAFPLMDVLLPLTYPWKLPLG
jgi:hypothetical protein